MCLRKMATKNEICVVIASCVLRSQNSCPKPKEKKPNCKMALKELARICISFKCAIHFSSLPISTLFLTENTALRLNRTGSRRPICSVRQTQQNIIINLQHLCENSANNNTKNYMLAERGVYCDPITCKNAYIRFIFIKVIKYIDLSGVMSVYCC